MGDRMVPGGQQMRMRSDHREGAGAAPLASCGSMGGNWLGMETSNILPAYLDLSWDWNTEKNRADENEHRSLVQSPLSLQWTLMVS